MFGLFSNNSPRSFPVPDVHGPTYDKMAHICIVAGLHVVRKKKVCYFRFLILTQRFPHNTCKNAVTPLRYSLVDGGKVLCKCWPSDSHYCMAFVSTPKKGIEIQMSE